MRDESETQSEAEQGAGDLLFPDLPVRAPSTPGLRVGASVPPPPPRRGSLAPQAAAQREAQPWATEEATQVVPMETGPRPVVAREPEPSWDEELDEAWLEDDVEPALEEDHEPAPAQPVFPAAIGHGLTLDDAAAQRAAPQSPARLSVSAGRGTFAPAFEEAERSAQIAPPVATQSLAEALGVAQFAAPSITPSAATQATGGATGRSPLLMGLVIAAAIALCFTWYMVDRKREPGMVQVNAQPLDALVVFDGAAIGSASPVLKTGIEPGVRHRIEVRREGYRAWVQEIEVRPGQSLFFPVMLQPLAASPDLANREPQAPVGAALPSAPPPAQEVVAQLPPQAAKPEPVRAAIDTQMPRRASADVSAPAARTKPPTTPANKSNIAPSGSGSTGTLRISSRPWSVVRVDGKVIGNTPQLNLKLSAGTHRVELTNPEFQLTKTLTVELQPDDTKTVIVDLQPTDP